MKKTSQSNNQNIIQASEFEFLPFGFPKANTFDPLEGDRAFNAIVMRMLYTTPIEVTVDNKLSSQVFNKFSYSANSKTISFYLKDDIFFSDNSAITADDIVFGIIRMALARPSFPVLREIIGLEKWLLLPNPLRSLPEGVKVGNDGKLITIQLGKDVTHPLFRFCLELFSVLPKKCFDLEKNKLTCKAPASSGHYIISNETAESIEFTRFFSKQKRQNLTIPSKIKFIYSETKNFKSMKKSARRIVWGTDYSFLNLDFSLQDLGYHVTKTPVSHFMGLLLNPKIPPFDDRSCRLFFAKKLRTTAKRMFGAHNNLTRSMFPQIVAGHLDNKQFNETDEQDDNINCQNQLKHSEFEWQSYKGSIFDGLIVETLRSLGTHKPPIKVFDTRHELEESFVNGNTPFYRFGSGFWALDPKGDVEMLFTKGLHPVLKYVIDTPKVTKILKSISECDDTVSERQNLEDLNRAVYESGLYIILMDFNFYYASTDPDIMVELPQAIQVAYPWQLFRTNYNGE